MRQQPLRATCRNGHAYTPENTRISTGGKRVCRACVRDTSKREHTTGGTGHIVRKSA